MGTAMASFMCRTCGEIFEWSGHKSKSYHCPRCSKNAWMRQQYGVTYDEAVQMQGGETCALCGDPEGAMHGGTFTHLSADHNHETGELRGLLCRGCNVLLGRIENMAEDWYERAIRYLEEGGSLTWGGESDG